MVMLKQPVNRKRGLTSSISLPYWRLSFACHFLPSSILCLLNHPENQSFCLELQLKSCKGDKEPWHLLRSKNVDCSISSEAQSKINVPVTRTDNRCGVNHINGASLAF